MKEIEVNNNRFHLRLIPWKNKSSTTNISFVSIRTNNLFLKLAKVSQIYRKLSFLILAVRVTDRRRFYDRLSVDVNHFFVNRWILELLNYLSVQYDAVHGRQNAALKILCNSPMVLESKNSWRAANLAPKPHAMMPIRAFLRGNIRTSLWERPEPTDYVTV